MDGEWGRSGASGVCGWGGARGPLGDQGGAVEPFPAAAGGDAGHVGHAGHGIRAEQLRQAVTLSDDPGCGDSGEQDVAGARGGARGCVVASGAAHFWGAAFRDALRHENGTAASPPGRRGRLRSQLATLSCLSLL